MFPFGVIFSLKHENGHTKNGHRSKTTFNTQEFIKILSRSVLEVNKYIHV